MSPTLYLFEKSPEICAVFMANAITKDLIISFVSKCYSGILVSFPILLAKSFLGSPIEDESFP